MYIFRVLDGQEVLQNNSADVVNLGYIEAKLTKTAKWTFLTPEFKQLFPKKCYEVRPNFFCVLIPLQFFKEKLKNML